MIPKTIHYCWFGGKPMLKSAEKYLRTWKRYFPDWEIQRWDENNFDVNIIPYTQAAYRACKYAFVSDYVRYKALYDHGGVYFDTDVEVIKSFDDIIASGPFLGIEKSSETENVYVNPGLCMCAEKNMKFYEKMLKVFERWEPSGSEIGPLLVKETTRMLVKEGWKRKDLIQKIDGITIYPNDFFNPMDDYTGKITVTHNTRSIHHYAKSWVNNYGPLRDRIAKLYHRFLLLLRHTPS